ncbi:MAG: hypothetical protein M0R74_04635 [Dehalococcoidia bacterium]|nr:hypothetical protein [Dehalococcoidia bacterium]
MSTGRSGHRLPGYAERGWLGDGSNAGRGGFCQRDPGDANAFGGTADRRADSFAHAAHGTGYGPGDDGDTPGDGVRSGLAATGGRSPGAAAGAAPCAAIAGRDPAGDSASTRAVRFASATAAELAATGLGARLAPLSAVDVYLPGRVARASRAATPPGTGRAACPVACAPNRGGGTGTYRGIRTED